MNMKTRFCIYHLLIFAVVSGVASASAAVITETRPQHVHKTRETQVSRLEDQKKETPWVWIKRQAGRAGNFIKNHKKKFIGGTALAALIVALMMRARRAQRQGDRADESGLVTAPLSLSHLDDPFNTFVPGVALNMLERKVNRRRRDIWHKNQLIRSLQFPRENLEEEMPENFLAVPQTQSGLVAERKEQLEEHLEFLQREMKKVIEREVALYGANLLRITVAPTTPKASKKPIAPPAGSPNSVTRVVL